ncbi:hypothetical protein [Streptomyces pseudovenezuelae]|uniref:Uncharacterized protein n=1 Tax=Streptomyces pseudovenezuelae TaxID=67350 RepID=A0ABT6LT70_9ACTN|nr:hypothetical protein [Streptomyces pseudovenezuelae]MDH6219481.1 hypothetical protein [Streptomyces pseudovenezuelae]
MENRRKEEGQAPKRKVLDLTAVQVAASALATVVGAFLASLLGVTGTIIGAAVVSTSATTGAAVFQHAFRRTGEEIRSRVPLVGVPKTPTEERAEARADARAAFALPPDPSPDPSPDALLSGEEPPFVAPEGESVTTYRGGSLRKTFGWKKYALATGLVFALAMVTVTAVELIAGKPVSAVVKNEPGKGTSVGGGSADDSHPTTRPSLTPGTSSGTAPQPRGSTTPDASAAPETGSGSEPSQSSTPESSPTPETSASSVPSGGGALNSSDVTAP